MNIKIKRLFSGLIGVLFLPLIWMISMYVWSLFGYDKILDIGMTPPTQMGYVVVFLWLIYFILNVNIYLKSSQTISDKLIGIILVNSNNKEKLSKKILLKRFFKKFLFIFLIPIILAILSFILARLSGREGAAMTFLIFLGITGFVFICLLLITIFSIIFNKKGQTWYDKKSGAIYIIKK